MLKCMRNIHTLVMLVVKYVDVSTSARIYHRILACRRSMHRRGRRGTLATLWLSMEAVFLLLCACKLIMRQRPHFSSGLTGETSPLRHTVVPVFGTPCTKLFQIGIGRHISGYPSKIFGIFLTGLVPSGRPYKTWIIPEHYRFFSNFAESTGIYKKALAIAISVVLVISAAPV